MYSILVWEMLQNVENIESIEANDAETEPVQSPQYAFYKPETREHAYYDLGVDIGLSTHCWEIFGPATHILVNCRLIPSF